jgi:hypothetical protein
MFLGVVFSKNHREASQRISVWFFDRLRIETLQKITSRLLRVSPGRFLKRFGIEALQEIHLDASLHYFFIKTRAPNTNHKLLIRDA